MEEPTNLRASQYLGDSNYKSGYLVKQGGRIKTWKKRLCILDKKNKVLKYYKNQEDTAPKGMIELEGYEVADADDIIKKPYSFVLTKENCRSYYMVCDDLPTKMSWMDDLREAAKGKKSSISAAPLSYDNDTDLSDDDEDITLKRANNNNNKNNEVTLAHRPQPQSPLSDEVTVFKPGGGKPTKLDDGVDQTLVSNFQSSSRTQDPNATLIGDFDENATLIADSSRADPNATLVGFRDENATLVGDGGGMQLVNNAARIRQLAALPQVVPHVKLIPFHDTFTVMERDVLRTIKFGRKKEDSNNDPDFIGFDSKVVSRRHAELWAVNGDFYIRDTKSQSGTFLNAMRLSLPGEESKPFKLKNGDTIQFGVDYRGSVDHTTKCVSMTIEITLIKQAESKTPAKSPLPNVPLNLSDLTLISKSK